ncbi:hypothetical protein BJY01DRAFT_233545 [Aspergillus pseudoustus]|uniref:Uncharacterized protein n=1 Tax=Aspergillus pseudoustus TaxID=1810923 RepID=A0ABR4KBF5_9EURO
MRDEHPPCVPLQPYTSKCKARLRIPHATGTHFDETAAQLEGFSRSLWAIASLAGTDDQHPKYWGEMGPNDQRMVEAEVIAFALLATPKLWGLLSQVAQQNLKRWLQRINGKEIPRANWLWAVEDDEEFEHYKKTGKAHVLRKSRNADYYSGSFAIQFSQLLNVRFAEFGHGFCGFFDSGVAAIPFGRSLTYRFACAGFFAALAFANVPNMPEPLASPGAVKGYLLRHLRWWARNSDNIFKADSVLNLGWTYPYLRGQMFLTEEAYNSPQSVYWALKTFIVIGLSATDLFWLEPEVSYPSPALDTALRALPAPRQIICNHPAGSHHFLLSLGRYIAHPFKGAVAKYSQFAYSSSFGFSVPCGGQGLAQIAPENTLALSRDGMQTWATKYRCREPEFKSAVVHGARPEVVPAASVIWWPWADRGVVVETTVIPPTTRWPDWHIRIHRVTASPGHGKLFTAEGGFAIHGRHQKNTLGLRNISQAELDHGYDVEVLEGVLDLEDGYNQSTLILSEQGASGIAISRLQSSHGLSTVSALKPESNTNVMRQWTLIPLAEHKIRNIGQDGEILLVTNVFAISREANLGWKRGGKSLKDRWLDQPEIEFGGIEIPGEDYLTVL